MTKAFWMEVEDDGQPFDADPTVKKNECDIDNLTPLRQRQSLHTLPLSFFLLKKTSFILSIVQCSPCINPPIIMYHVTYQPPIIEKGNTTLGEHQRSFETNIYDER